MITFGHAEGAHDVWAPSGLRAIWVRNPTDLFDASVPLRVYKLPGDPGEKWRHMVQVPDGCELFCHPFIEQGTAFLVFDGGDMWAAGGRLHKSGKVQEVKGRKRAVMVPGGGLLTKVPNVGAGA